MKFNIQEILDFLPHRYPFLLIDRIVEFEPAKRLVAIKNVTINEPFFQGHFPGYPIMPGVLVIEAMAQAGGIIMMAEMPDRHEKLVVFTGIERAKIRRPVTPGDQLRIEVDVLSFRSRAGRIQGVALVDGKKACEADLTCQVVTRQREQRAHDDSGATLPRRKTRPGRRWRSEHSSERDRRSWSSSPRFLHGRPLLHNWSRGGSGRGLRADLARGDRRPDTHRCTQHLLSV